MTYTEIVGAGCVGDASDHLGVGASAAGPPPLGCARTAPNATLVSLPVHASWVNQVLQIYFSTVQRKVLTSDDLADLADVEQLLLDSERRYEAAAQPFEWNSPATTRPSSWNASPNTKRSLTPHEYVTELPCQSTKANCRPVRETAIGNMARTAVAMTPTLRRASSTG